MPPPHRRSTPTIVQDPRQRQFRTRGRSSEQFQRPWDLERTAPLHRKHAIRVLAGREKRPSGNKSNSLRYGSNVREALIVLWETSERLCSKRLKPLIPVL